MSQLYSEVFASQPAPESAKMNLEISKNGILFF